MSLAPYVRIVARGKGRARAMTLAEAQDAMALILRGDAAPEAVGALLMVDMAHFAGLVAAGEHPSPFPYADVATTTTHKTLRGPRGGMILTNDEAIAKKVNSAIFPGIQGGPLMHVIAAKAVAFGEALKPEFKTYIQQVIKNAQALSDQLINTFRRRFVKALFDKIPRRRHPSSTNLHTHGAAIGATYRV